MKTFFILWLFIDDYHSPKIVLDHYDTLAECEAVKAVIVDQYKDEWISPDWNKFKCLKVVVQQ